MKHCSNIFSVLISAVLLFSTPIYSTSASAEDITIGTGGRAGVYFQVGRALCRLLDQQAQSHDITCESLSTAGSISNLNDIREGKLQIGVAQSDWQYHAVNGSSKFADSGKDDNLRALFSVHGEPFTLVVRQDSGIGSISDLEGKRVNIGNPGSGQRATMEVVMETMGWTKDSFALANELPASQQSLSLCHDEVQAMVYTVGHPNDSVAQAVELCEAKIAQVQGGPIDALVNDNPFYAYTEVPGGVYPGNDDSVTTFGVKATVVSSADIDEDTIYTVVSTIFDNLDEFKKMHPAFAHLQADNMVKDGLSAPLHAGAERYFKEKGLL